MMNKLGKQDGVTLVALVITVIVMIILVSVSIVAVDIIEKAKEQGIMSDMFLIQTKVKMINEKVNFDEDESIYVGLKLKDQQDGGRIIAKGVLTDAELEDDKWYIYDRATLDSIGLEGIKLKKDEVYLVNYNTAEIRSPDNSEKLPAEGYSMDSKPQPTPLGEITFSHSPTDWTKDPVVLRINYKGSSIFKKQYKIGDGEWVTYINPLSITGNGFIYARLENRKGETSTECSISINNIDNLPL